MHPASLGLVAASSTLLAVAVWSTWIWLLPMLRQQSHLRIDNSLNRLGEIGFDAAKIRFRLFLFEVCLFVAIGFGYWYYFGLVLTVVLTAIYFHVRSLVLISIIDRREKLLRFQILSLTVGLNGLTQSGLSLPQAVLQIAGQTPAPLGKPMQKVASNYRLGRPLNEAIAEVRSRLCLDSFSLLVTSITCSLKQGTPLSDALNGVQEALEHRDQVERQLSAKTASARTTILVLSVAPIFFLVIFALFMSESMQLLFQTSSGKVMLALIIGLLYAGVAWARSLLRIR